MEKPFYEFIDKNIHEDNLEIKFWNLVKSLKEKKEIKETSIIPLIPHIATKYIQGKSPLIENITPFKLSYLLIDFLWKREELNTLIKENMNSPPFILALSKKISEKGEEKYIRELLNKESTRTSLLLALKNSPTDLIKSLKKELINIAQKEVEKNQYLALEILSYIVEDEEVKELFLSLADDWDKEVRKIVVKALTKLRNDEKVKEKIRESYEIETDPYISFLMKSIINNNDEPNIYKDT